MSPAARSFCRRWLVTTLGVLTAAQMVSGIHFDHWPGLVVASLLLGILNAFVRPLLVVFSLPLLVFSLGLFLWVINAVLLYTVGWLVKPFHVDSFGAAFWGALVISIVTLLANWLLGPESPRPTVRPPPRPPPPADTGHGPVIDV